MRSVRVHGIHDPEVRVDEVPGPAAPSGTQVLVRVTASSINGTDRGFVGGPLAFRLLRGTTASLGFDLTGEVVACGGSVTSFATGDRVLALLPHAGGAQSELVLLDQSRAARVPGSVDPVAAAALPLAGLTALQALHGAAGLHRRPGSRVLVIGAAGGIGSFGVQLAALAGARVTAVARDEDADRLRGLGAAEVVDRHRQDPFTGGTRWDVVLDTPGALAFAAVRPHLAGDGVHVSTRPVSPDSARALVDAARHRGGPRFAAVRTSARPGDLARLVALVESGELRPPVERVAPLAEAPSVYRDVLSGGMRGKTVLTA